MHPQLADKRLVCQEFIQALEECHSDSWKRFTGGCNEVKQELNMCLRKERVERTARNQDDAKERNVRKQTAWQELHKDD